MFEVNYYRLENGAAPVEQFIDGLNPKMQAKAMYSLALLEEFGNQLREPFSKPIGDGIFELRIKFSSDITRIFYFFVVDNKIILTNGIVKKTPKTPKAEIELAKKNKMKGEILMSDFRNHLARVLENPEFQKEYENGKAEYEVTRALVAARIEQNLTQAQLAERSGVRQSNISRIENGTCSPTIATLEQLATGMGKKLRIEFV